MDEKFCFGCAKYKKADQMTKLKRGNGWRLMCQNCIELKSGSWYSKEKKDAKKVG